MLFNLLQTVAVDTTQLYKILDKINSSTHAIEENTQAGFWDYAIIVFLCIAILLIFIWLIRILNISQYILVSQIQTQDNTQRLDKDYQRSLLLDLVRHLYRNLVITYTMYYKMEAKTTGEGENKKYTHYPSEEHLIKLCVPMEWFHLDLFYHDGDEKFRAIEKLYMDFRNYNEEVKVVLSHFKDKTVDYATKERDFKTLLFKSGYLTDQILEKANIIWENGKKDMSSFKLEAVQLVSDAIYKSHTIEKSDMIVKPELIASYKLLIGANHVDFINDFNRDVTIECGYNTSGGEKVHLIELK